MAKRARKTTSRQIGIRNPLHHVLIVCEDKKSACIYFEKLKELKKAEWKDRLVTKVNSGDTSTHLSVVETAKRLAEQYKAKDEQRKGYDKIFCVFDMDRTDTYQQAVALISKNSNFAEIRSYPCFEYWVLLHFIDHHAPFDSCNKVGDRIKKENKGIYDKGSFAFFEDLVEGHPVAADRARKKLENNPYTHVYQIIDYLNENCQLT